MTKDVTVRDKPQGRSVLLDMAARYGMEPEPFEKTLRATVVPDKCTREQFAAFLLVAKEYELNPILKEIYAFPTRGGGIQPIVSIDGWMNLINSHPNMDGIEFDDHFEEGDLMAITARIWRKDRSHPIVVTEYMEECRRDTDPWNKWPRRMLRHKAAIQCARYAFGFAGIIDPDEAERSPEVVSDMRNVTPKPPPVPTEPEKEQPVDVEVINDDVDPATGEVKGGDADSRSNGTLQHATDKTQPQPSEAGTKSSFPGTEDPEKLLSWIEDKCAAVTGREEEVSLDEFQEMWNSQIEPVLQDLFPPDVEEATKIYTRHARKLGEDA